MNNKTLSIINGLFLLATITINYLANALPIGGMTTGELSDLYPNLFVPAGFTFSIRGVIYLLLIAFAVWQLLDAWTTQSRHIAKKIGWWFILSCMLNMARIVTWHYLLIGLSVIIMLGLLGTLIVLAKKTRNNKTYDQMRDKWCLETPFAVYLGRISVATIANISTYLVDIGWNMWGMTDIFWTIVVIVVATLLAVLALTKKANIPYALVILRALYGIYSKRVEVDPVYAQHIIWALYICMVVIGGGIARRGQKWWRG